MEVVLTQFDLNSTSNRSNCHVLVYATNLFNQPLHSKHGNQICDAEPGQAFLLLTKSLENPNSKTFAKSINLLFGFDLSSKLDGSVLVFFFYTRL